MEPKPNPRKTKRLSGYKYRRQAAHKKEEKAKLGGALKHFLIPQRPQEHEGAEEGASTSSAADGDSAMSIAPETVPVALSPMEVESSSMKAHSDNSNSSSSSFSSATKSETEPQEGELLGQEQEYTSDTLLDILPSDDPGIWLQNISSNMARTLAKRGPKQIKNLDFPPNEYGRKFSPDYYNRQLPNGEEINRDWLIYSTSKNSVYCFCCKIFGKSLSALSDSEGFSDWQHLSLTLLRHEKSVNHNENIKTWSTLVKMLKTKSTVDIMQQRLLDGEKAHWYAVTFRIISIIGYLSRQCLAFRGSSQKLLESNNGNFLKAVEMIAQFDSVMREHINRIERSREKNVRMSHYLGEKIQNEIIQIIGNRIKNVILDLIKNCKYYSIILDCTPDISHTEQITIVFRFVLLNDITKKVEIREHFIGFCPITNSKGEGLKNFILDLLAKLKLNINNMRGQGYDNGANMRGKHNGLQKKILDVAPRAFFVPCAAHSLNLVVNDAATISHDTVEFFDLVQEFYVYFSASTKRWTVLKNHISGLTLKPLSDTRWSSRLDAIKPLRYQVGEIYDALLEIAEHTSLDPTSRHKARSLATKFQTYKFLCSLVIWHELLFKINTLSKMMQSITLNIKVCLDYLHNLIDFFSNYRSDEAFNKVLNEASELANELEVDASFPVVQLVRPRRKPRLFEYEHRDETPLDPQLNFKTNFFYAVLDQTLTSLRERFESLERYNDIFGFLNRINDYVDDDLLKHCKDLHLKLRDDLRNESDIDGIDLFNEIKALKLHFDTLQNDPQFILQYIFENNLLSTFPNTAIALRILLTLPVSVASGERSFSKLKIIKNYMRSTMLQDRLSNLAIISIEHNILDSLNMDDTIKEFVEHKIRKIQIL